MSSLGSKVSNLQLAMFDKKLAERESPIDNEMIQTTVKSTLVKDDLDGDDVTVYQSVANQNDDHSLESTSFGEGGAFAQAIAEAAQEK